jgi:biopolymer transport protein ExbD
VAAKEKSASTQDVELNMTPMIDVVFNLIIFFMVITDLTQRELEELTLPVSDQAVEDTQTSTDRVIINVIKGPDWEENRAVRVMIGGREYDWQQLREYLYVAAARGKPDLDAPSEVPVLIRCDKDIRWREVQWVMQSCADAAVKMYRMEFATAEDVK